MVKLSDLQVALLLEEIACAMRVGSPIVESMRRLQSHRLGGVGRAAGSVAERLERGEGVSAAFSAVDSKASIQAAAAIESATACRDPGIMERLAFLLRQRSTIAKDTRIAWFYPWVLLAVAYVVATVVIAPMILRVEGRDFHWDNWVVRSAEWLVANWWVPPLLFAVLFVLFVVWISSRNCFSRPARLSLFCQSLADQFSQDVPEDVAIRAAAEMSGDEQLMSITDPSLRDPLVAEILGSVPFQAAGAEIGVKATLIAQLRYLGSIFGERARRRAFFWSRLLPRCAMVVVGGGFTFFFVLWVIAPVYLQVAKW